MDTFVWKILLGTFISEIFFGVVMNILCPDHIATGHYNRVFKTMLLQGSRWCRLEVGSGKEYENDVAVIQIKFFSSS